MAVSAPDLFSSSVRDMARQLGDGPVTAWQIVHVLLRDHPGYGGSSLLPLDGRSGRAQPVVAWLDEMARVADFDGSEGSLHGLTVIEALARLEPPIGEVLAGAGLGGATEADGSRTLAASADLVGLAIGRLGDEDVLAWADGQRVRVLDPLGSVIRELAAGAPIRSVAVARLATGPVVVAARSDGRLGVWDVEGRLLGTPSHTGVTVAAADADGALITGAEDGTVMRWTTSLGPPTRMADFSGASVLDITSGIAGGVAVLQADGVLRAPSLELFLGRDATCVAAASVPGREAFVVGDGAGRVRIVDASDGTALGNAASHRGRVAAVSVGTLGGRRVVASGGADGLIRLTDLGPAEGGTVADDATEWQSDRPEREHDLLGRRPLAAELGRRLRRIHADGAQRGSFVVHLDGPWGSGKTTILNYLRAELGADWLTVEVNAWREHRVRPAWYALLTRLRAAVRDDLGAPRRRAGFRVREHGHRTHAAGPALWVAVALTVGLLTAVLALDAGWVTTTLALVATLYAAATLLGRFLFWDSAGSARFFERANPDPMERVARHIAWLLAEVARNDGRPVLFLVDDLDRCDPEHVVEVLEAVQTLVRDGAPGAAGPYVVVAADGAWVRHCYEDVYAKFCDVIGTPGQPLGYLFLDKLFQLSLELPRLTPGRQEAYLRGLLGTAGANGAAPDADAVAQVRAAADEGAVLAAVAEASAASPEVQEEVISAAVSRLGERRVEAADRHALEAYAGHLPANPRAMKRFVNAYGLARAVHVIELADVAMGPRAAWTILRMRWPALADALRERPELSAVALDPGAAPHPEAPAELVALLRTPAVGALLRAGGEPLDAATIGRVTGAAGAAGAAPPSVSA